jgi:hypothetical protein
MIVTISGIRRRLRLYSGFFMRLRTAIVEVVPRQIGTLKFIIVFLLLL